MKVAVLRALPGLGDFLCAVPALRALRDTELTWIGLPQTRELAARYGWIDRYFDFPGWPGLPEVELDPRRVTAFLAARQADEFDLALQLHGTGLSSGAFVELLGARRSGGFVPAGTPAPGDGWLTWVEDESEVLRPLRLLEHHGIEPAGRELELPLTAGDEAQAAQVGLPASPYAVLHAGSSLPSRRWPAERFAAVADALAARGVVPVLTGTPAEHEAVEAVAAAMRTTPEVLLGRTSLGAFAVVVRDAALVVTNDTGTSHLAAAVHAPSVVLFMVTDPRRWGPVDRTRHRALPGTASADDVLAAADPLLGG